MARLLPTDVCLALLKLYLLGKQRPVMWETGRGPPPPLATGELKKKDANKI